MDFEKIPSELYEKLYNDYVMRLYTCDLAITPSMFKEHWEDLTEEERQIKIERIETETRPW